MKTKTLFTSLLLIFVYLWLLSACRPNDNAEVELPSTLAITTTDKPQTTIIVTPPTVEIAQPDIKPPVESGLVFSQISLYYDKNGIPGVVGLVRNDSGNVLVEIEVNIQFFDPADQLLDSLTTDLLITNLRPGEISPFILRSQKELPGLDHINSSIVEAKIGDLEKGEVIVRNELWTLDATNNTHLTGELYNGSIDPIKINSLAAALFDNNNEIISAASQAAAIQYLDPGEFGPFRVTIPFTNTLNLHAMDYALYIDAEIVPPLPYPNIIINENPNPSLDQNSMFHLLGDVSNNSEQTVSVNLVAGIYDTNGDVLDASSIRLPVSIDPGETLPYDFSEWGLMSIDGNIQNQASKYSVQLNIFPYTDQETEYFLLKTQANEYSYDGDSGTFTGEITNNSGQTLSLTIVIVSIYDKTSGELIRTGEQVFQTEFFDGNTFQYEITMDLDEKYDPDLIEIENLAKGRISE